MNIIFKSENTGAMFLYTGADEFSRQLMDLLRLTDGWHFGEGSALTLKTIGRAAWVGYLLLNAGAESREVFPDANGGVLVVGYRNNDDIEILCEPDGPFQFTYISDGHDVAHYENLSREALDSLLGEYGWKQEKSYAFFIPNITAEKNVDIQVLPLRQLEATYRSFAPSAFPKMVATYAPTSGNFMTILYPATLPYSGDSIQTLCPTTPKYHKPPQSLGTNVTIMYPESQTSNAKHFSWESH